jgi:WD40 repeat protein
MARKIGYLALLPLTVAAIWGSHVLAAGETTVAPDRLPEHCYSRLGSLSLRHPGVIGIAVSPTSSEAVSLGAGYLRAWDLATGDMRFEKKTADTLHPSFGNSILAFSSDGKRVFRGASFRGRTNVTVLDARTQNELTTFPTDDFCNHLCTAMAGQVLVGGGRRRGRITLWDLKNGQVIKTLDQGAPMDGMAPTPDGKTLVSAGGKGARSSIYIWDLQKGALLKKIAGNGLAFRSVAINPRGDTAVVSTSNGSVLVCDIKTGQILGTLPAPPKAARQAWFSRPDVPLVFEPGGDVLLVGGADGVIRGWDVARRKQTRTLSGHTDEVKALVLDVKGRSLISAGGDCTIRVWDLARGEEVAKCPGHGGPVSAVSFSPTNYDLVTGASGNELFQWTFPFRAPPRRLTCTPSEPPAAGQEITSISFSRKGDQMLTTAAQGPALLWDNKTHTVVRRFRAETESGYWAGHLWPEHGEALARTGQGEPRLWRLDDGAASVLKTVPGKDVKEMVLSADGRFLGIGVAPAQPKGVRRPPLPGHIQVVEPQAAKVLMEVKDVRWKCLSLAADGSLLAFVAPDPGYTGDRIHLWCVRKGNEVNRFPLPVAYAHVPAICFSPRKDLLACATDGGDVVLIDLRVGKTIGALPHRYVTCISFSHDGKFLASGSGDTTILIWDVERFRANKK